MADRLVGDDSQRPGNSLARSGRCRQEIYDRLLTAADRLSERVRNDKLPVGEIAADHLSQFAEILSQTDAEAALAIETAVATVRRRSRGDSFGASDDAGYAAAFKTLLGSTADGVALIREGRISYASLALAEMFGYSIEGLEGVEPVHLIAPESRSVIEVNRGDGEARNAEALGVRRSGSRFAVEIRHWDIGEVSGLVVIRDISLSHLADTRLPRHITELAHAQRLSTLGELASSLAHELNQPLAAIVNYTRGCIRRMRSAACGPDHAAILDALEQVTAQGDRAAQILRRIREFVRKREPIRAVFDLNDVISDAVSMTRYEAKDEGVQVSVDLTPESLPVVADRIQLEQVILNLVRNGYDALKVSGVVSKKLAIRTMCCEDNAEVSVEDNGAGLSPKLLERVFDAFFTTKAEGMGLGLSISRSIVEAHRGHLLAERSAGGGTVFRVVLPIDKGDEDHGC